MSGCCLRPTLQLFSKLSPISQQSFGQIVRVNVPRTVCMIVDQIKKLKTQGRLLVIIDVK